jgi:hypothetical protein
LERGDAKAIEGFITQDPFHLSFRMQNAGSNLIMEKIFMSKKLGKSHR